jgi:hypothetical protein
MVACVSNEYAKSENCIREFRFTHSLKKPIVMCTFGSADVNCEWRSTELGILSCLLTREINFQLENPEAFSSLLAELNAHKVEPSLLGYRKKRLIRRDSTPT